MKISFLISGFPRGFTEEFIESLKEHYHNDGALVFIASDFAGYSKTDRHLGVFLDMFKNSGITFNKLYTIDNRITREEAIKYIKEADIIWIAGGDTLKQIGHLKEYGLIPVLQEREGITIGMSAGAINMAKRVVLPKDADDNIPELSIYDGIGLVDINVEPHLDSATEEHMKDIYEASKHTSIYGIYDNSFIKSVNNIIEIHGDYLKFESNKRR